MEYKALDLIEAVLNKGLKQKIIENINNELTSELKNKYTVKSIFEEKYVTINNVIMSCFTWRKTKELFPYWDNIYTSNISIDLNLIQITNNMEKTVREWFEQVGDIELRNILLENTKNHNNGENFNFLVDSLKGALVIAFPWHKKTYKGKTWFEFYNELKEKEVILNINYIEQEIILNVDKTLLPW